MYLCGIFESYANNVMTLNFLRKVVQVRFDLPLKLLPQWSKLHTDTIFTSSSKNETQSYLSGNWAWIRTYTICCQHPLMDFPVCKFSIWLKTIQAERYEKISVRSQVFWLSSVKAILNYIPYCRMLMESKLQQEFFFRRASVQFKWNSSEII